VSIWLDPFIIGGRLHTMASLFTQYRMLRCSFQFVPRSTASGVMSNVAGTTTTPSYGSRTISVGTSPDAAYAPSTYLQILDMGGKSKNTSRGFSLNITRMIDKRWKFTSATNASPTVIDLRSCAFTLFACAFSDTSTTASATYGSWICRWYADFRGPIASAPAIGLQFHSNMEDEKDETGSSSDSQSAGASLEMSDVGNLVEKRLSMLSGGQRATSVSVQLVPDRAPSVPPSSSQWSIFSS